ncbi:alpha/beta fold hydrolase [Candidatus Contubernalis alkaliaceticus]|uniref:alpha/beta fold hydrolase n=1 Tax=Candidatus Contubernalis alkaliaceticus TaxID=338645 RepID=UPI001F4BF241|nr:alpha/beta hydrolase [Candidatus Contubernalis alkalaceticus]UNC92093.1 alpha/beta hydrolase [Candidatus Contubernalis alkalaceticus]
MKRTSVSLKICLLKWYADRPESQLKMVENAHHIVNQDKPEELNKILLDFLKERQNVE